VAKRNIEQELTEDLENLKAFHRGEKELVTRTVDLTVSPPAEIRKRLNVSQHAFAGLLGVSVRTIQDWEQGRRQPSGPAKALLRIVDQNPEVLINLR
jgi:putative transcriptional regulator